MEKRANFTQFEQKNTHISGCKIMHLCTIVTITVHICTVTVAYAFNILLVFSLSLVSALTLTLTGLSLVTAFTSPHYPFSSFALTLTTVTSQTMPPLSPVKPYLHCRRFWASSPFRRFSLWASGFWDSGRNPLKQHEDAMNDVMNECFADQPSQPQQRRINLRNPIKWRGDEQRDERVLRRS